MSRDLIVDLLRTARTGRTELVRQNAYDLLLKLALDGDREARQAVEVVERTNKLMESSIVKSNSSR